MSLNRILILIETIFLVLPAVLLSAIWLFIMGGNIYEELFVDAGTASYSLKELIEYLVHFCLALLSHAAVWALLFLASIYTKSGQINIIKGKTIMVVLVGCGIFITLIGVVMHIFNYQGVFNKDFYQMFGTYSLGVIVILPAIHLLVINHRTNNLLQPTANASAE